MSNVLPGNQEPQNLCPVPEGTSCRKRTTVVPSSNRKKGEKQPEISVQSSAGLQKKQIQYLRSYDQTWASLTETVFSEAQ